MAEAAKAESAKTPNDFIINPVLAIHTQVDDLAIETNELKEVSKEHSKLLSEILDREGSILKQLQDLRDEGGKATFNGTALNSKFTIIDTNKDPAHKVKSAVVTNNGPNILYVGEDAALSPEVDADLTDIVSDQTRFIAIFPGESERFAYNVRSIRSVHLLADPTVVGAIANYRVRMAW